MESIEGTARALSEIERKALKQLAGGKEKTEETVCSEGGINIDSVRRAFAWLQQKGLIGVREEKARSAELTPAGKDCLEKGLPEKRLLNSVRKSGGKLAMKDALAKSGLGKAEFGFALGWNKAKAFIMVLPSEQGPVLELTEVAKEFAQKKSAEEQALEAIETGSMPEQEILAELVKRGICQEKETTTRTAKISDAGRKALEIIEGKSAAERTYNIFDPVPRMLAGKRQPYIQFLSQIRRKLVELGFREMPTRLVELEFYNFDVLFQPQNHPARTWTDTYQLKRPVQGKLPDKKLVALVKQAHESGGKTKSAGWKYGWSEQIAQRLMPCAHGTAASARQVAGGVEVPGKYFALARCYRPDVVDATHLNEFNQMEGFIVDESFNFRHLLGMLKQFATEIAGAEEVKFYPDYYPFTEPSVQLSAKHPTLGWIEFGGAGIFRPEFTEQLGVKGKCLAWGLGIDRLAMFKLGIKDIRQLFSTDLEWLRNEKMVRV
ncbi:MAG: phenylalanine--tRNA ligase subunit alpha [Candidatus Diapherotrites archaeon]|nr:phenylalanine--tRNA ligase subunit alpha [Candidatus Diapherotrites archaeon]